MSANSNATSSSSTSSSAEAASATVITPEMTEAELSAQHNGPADLFSAPDCRVGEFEFEQGLEPVTGKDTDIICATCCCVPHHPVSNEVTESRKTIAQLGLSQQLGHEIECNVQWKLAHPTETTSSFSNVTRNLHGDSPRPWTAVQIYIWNLLQELFTSAQERVQKLILIAFPNCQNVKAKLLWGQSNSMFLIHSYFTAYYIFCFIFLLL